MRLPFYLWLLGGLVLALAVLAVHVVRRFIGCGAGMSVADQNA